MQQTLTDTISEILVMHLLASSTAMQKSTCAFMDGDARGPQGDDPVALL